MRNITWLRDKQKCLWNQMMWKRYFSIECINCTLAIASYNSRWFQLQVTNKIHLAILFTQSWLMNKIYQIFLSVVNVSFSPRIKSEPIIYLLSYQIYLPKHICLPATSVPSEFVLSTTGDSWCIPIRTHAQFEHNALVHLKNTIYFSAKKVPGWCTKYRNSAPNGRHWCNQESETFERFILVIAKSIMIFLLNIKAWLKVSSQFPLKCSVRV